MDNKILIFIIILALIIVGFVVFFNPEETDNVVVTDFIECEEAGYSIMESYPRQCTTPDGETFTEDIGNELEKQDLIKVDSPRPNQVVQSPLTITGEARGTWFFEGDFPVSIEDSNGKELGLHYATAEGEWMTEDFVSFTSELEFEEPTTERGVLKLHKDIVADEDIPDTLIIPVLFETGE